MISQARSDYEISGRTNRGGNVAREEPLLLKAVEGRRLKLGDQHPHTIESLNNLINLYEAWNKPEKANELRTKLEQIEDFEE
jgi:hypothetical protein